MNSETGESAARGVSANAGPVAGERAAGERGQTARRRLPGLDVTKGLAAIGVVAIHAAPAAPSAYVDHVVGGLARLGVPAFLVVSGMALAIRGVSGQRFRTEFRRFLRLHLVWSAVYWIVVEVAVGVSTPRTLKWMLLRFGEGAYPGQYYFIVVLQIFAVLAAIDLLRDPLRLGVSREGRFWTSTPFAVASALAAAVGLSLFASPQFFAFGETLPRVAWRVVGGANVVWLWMIFFALGAWVGERVRRGSALTGPAAAKALALGAAALALLAWPRFPAPRPETLNYPYASLVLYLGAICIPFALGHFASRPAPRWLCAIGERSFGVFVLNPGLLIGLQFLWGAPESVFASWLHVGVTIAVACALTRPLERLVPWAMR